MIVYSNSCSFGSTTNHLIYPEIISTALSGELVNSGKPGCCNRRIIRTALRNLIELKQQNKDIIALIGLTFISRTELWQPMLAPIDNDGNFHSITISHRLLDWSKGLDTTIPDIFKYADKHVADYYKWWLFHYNPEAEITNLLTDLIMFKQWCVSNKIKYLIFSNVDLLPEIDLNAPFISGLVKELLQDPSVIDPWKFSFGTYALSKGHIPKDFNLYGKHGHPNQYAHLDFAQHLLLKYINV